VRRWASPTLWISLSVGCRPAVPAGPATAPVAVAPIDVEATPERPLIAVEPAAPSAPIEVPWSAADLPRIVAVQGLIHGAAHRHGVDPRVLNAIIWHESRFHAAARGPGGAAGLMQLMPTTSKGLAKRLGRANRPLDPAFNVEAGALLLSRLLTIFDGDLPLALAGYGLGHVAVQRRVEAGEPLPERTQRFVARVQSWVPVFATLPCPEGASAEPASVPAAGRAPGPLCGSVAASS
jgi:soluble lytic murein transglycosylase-like protein